MHGFWIFGGWGLRQGFHEELARLEKLVAAAETLDERQSQQAELDKTRQEFRDAKRATRRGRLNF
ncbi:MAG: hypothetical protein WD648_01635 [Planctomycetaceae bacterium]